MKTTVVWLSFVVLALFSACSSSDGGGGSSGDAGDTTIDGSTPGSDSSSGNDQSTGVDQSTGTDQSTNPGSCDTAPCGGDPTGSYSFGEICVDFGGMADEFDCDEATADGSMNATGTVGINAGNTYSLNVTNNYDVTITLPLSCLPNEGVCSVAGGTITGTNCVISDSGNETDEETGTWSTAGNTLTLVSDDGGDTNVFEYCKQGSSLILHDAGSADSPPMTIVLN